MRATLLALSILLFPVFSYAALNAGVVNGVWFSNDTPNEGEAVTIYTAVQNTSSEAVKGTVGFLVDGDIVGSASFVAPSNDIVPVSITHVFTDGTHEVSAYITSVESESVAYTTVPKVKITVADVPEVSESDDATNTTPKANDIAATVKDTVTNTSKDTVNTIEPVAESTAQRIETFRDTFITQSTSTDEQKDKEPETTTVSSGFVGQKKQVAKDFWDSAKDIITNDDTPMWKRAVALLLSVAAFLVRFWFVLVVLGVGFIFWRLVRGRRIS